MKAEQFAFNDQATKPGGTMNLQEMDIFGVENQHFNSLSFSGSKSGMRSR